MIVMMKTEAFSQQATKIGVAFRKLLPPDRRTTCIGSGHRGRSFVTKSDSRGILLSVGPKRRAAGAAEEETGTRERKSERGEVERAGSNP